jgi:plastocyanin
VNTCERAASRVGTITAIAILVLLPALIGSAPARSAPSSSHHMTMTDAEMQRKSAQWFATHPVTGAASPNHAAAVVTVLTMDYQFDADGNLGTVIDTVHINVGDTVTWQWVSGFHTATNGVDGGDPNLGLIFDGPLNAGQTTFSHTFTDAGVIPYFCQVHEGTMVGYIAVRSLTGVVPVAVGGIGFTRDPFPNPSARGFGFAFALPRAGRARAEVFDVRGRRIAVPLDLDLPAGEHSGAWDGRRTDGGRVEAAVYYLQLHLPGHTETRRMIVTR